MIYLEMVESRMRILITSNDMSAKQIAEYEVQKFLAYCKEFEREFVGVCSVMGGSQRIKEAISTMKYIQKTLKEYNLKKRKM